MGKGCRGSGDLSRGVRVVAELLGGSGVLGRRINGAGEESQGCWEGSGVLRPDGGARGAGEAGWGLRSQGCLGLAGDGGQECWEERSEVLRGSGMLGRRQCSAGKVLGVGALPLRVLLFS